MRRNFKLKTVFSFIAIPLLASACVSMGEPSERDIERRKQELCRKIATQNQPQCTGHHAPMPPDAQEPEFPRRPEKKNTTKP